MTRSVIKLRPAAYKATFNQNLQIISPLVSVRYPEYCRLVSPKICESLIGRCWNSLLLMKSAFPVIKVATLLQLSWMVAMIPVVWLNCLIRIIVFQIVGRFSPTYREASPLTLMQPTFYCQRNILCIACGILNWVHHRVWSCSYLSTRFITTTADNAPITKNF